MPLGRDERGASGELLPTGLFLHRFDCYDESYDSYTFRLELYDLSTGKRISEITCGGQDQLGRTLGSVRKLLADPGDPYLWIIGKNGERFTLYRWDYAASPVEDDTVYLQ